MLTAGAEPLGAFIGSVWAYRRVLFVLARADFQVRYKRASFGILWSVALPAVQAGVLVLVFSRFARFSDIEAYPVFVVSGIMVWTYLTGTMAAASSAIVDGATLTDKVWLPRAILVLVPVLANVVGLVVSTALLIVLLPLLDVAITARVLLMPFAVLLTVAFCGGVGLVLSALNVYYRDVKHLVQAALLAWFWLTPIAYPRSFAGNIAGALDLNPATGIVTMYRMATIGAEDWQRPVAVSVGVTLVAFAVAAEVYRRRDRVFVDLL